MKKTILLALLAAAAVACGTSKKATSTSPAPVVSATSSPMVGGQKDAHGCLTGAGYTWSVVRNDCIRTWEAGAKLLTANQSQANHATYVVFSADSTRAELFMPGKTLQINRLNDKRTWTGEAGTGVILRLKPAGLELFDGDSSITWNEAR